MNHAQPPKQWETKLAEAWKTVVAVVGALLILCNAVAGLDLWGARTVGWLNAAIAALTAAGVWLARNQKRAEQITGQDIDQDGVEG